MAHSGALTRFGMVRRSLFRQPLRATLTVLGVSLGVIAIVTLGSLVGGIRATIDSGVTLGGADLIVFQAGVSADILSTLPEDETRAKLKAMPEVADVAAGMSHVMPVEKQRFTVVLGVEPDGFTYSREYAQGEPIRNTDEASLGRVASRTFGKGIGDTIEVGGRTFRIVSVFETGVVVYDSAITLHLRTLQEMLGREGHATAFFVGLHPSVDVRRFINKLEAEHPELVGIASSSEYHKVGMGVEEAEGVVWIITLAAVIIGSVIVLNTMWMTVLERTREIGVLRAVGWSRGDVLRLVLVESLVIGVLAMLIGSALGVLLAKAIAIAPLTAQFVRPTFGVPQFAIAGCASVLLSVLGGAIPAWRAGRISPAEALRYE